MHKTKALLAFVNALKMKTFSNTDGSQKVKETLQVEHKKCNFLSAQCVGCLIEIAQPSAAGGRVETVICT